MTSIGGDSVSRVTIDGEDVREITVGGDTVFTYPPEDNLVAWYDFGEEAEAGRSPPQNDVPDKSGNGYSMTGSVVPFGSINGNDAFSVVSGTAAGSEASVYSGGPSLSAPYAFTIVLDLLESSDLGIDFTGDHPILTLALDQFGQPGLGFEHTSSEARFYLPSAVFSSDFGFGDRTVFDSNILTVIVETDDVRLRVDGVEYPFTLTSGDSTFTSSVEGIEIGHLNLFEGLDSGAPPASMDLGEFVMVDTPSDIIAWEQFLINEWSL